MAKLPFYAKVFDTVEVDSSFYRVPSKTMVAGWARVTEPSFKFSLKIPKTITHDRMLADADDDLRKFIEVLQPLRDMGKMGCLVIQLPPSFTYSEVDRLESFLSILPKQIQFAVEFRHESWNRDESWALLAKYNVANIITESPIEFLSKVRITSTTHAYVRWHGRGKQPWYDYTYSEEELNPWIKKIDEIEDRVPITYAYFNNHYRADAPRNALQFLHMRKESTELQEKIMRRMDRRKSSNLAAAGKISDFFQTPDTSTTPCR